MARDIWTSAFHIPGKDNFIADKLSRNFDREWLLSDEVFYTIQDKLGVCDIDLFASKDNHKLSKYVSYTPDSNVVAINAFSLTWTSFNAYIFPPFSLLGLVLQKIMQDQATVTLVAPVFHTQPWFVMLLQMTCQQPYLLPKPELSDITKQGGETPIEENEIECFQSLRETLLVHGISSDAVDIILSSWRLSTKKQYGAYVKRWLLFCDREKIDKFNPDINCVLKFLSHLFSCGIGYSGINTAKSAISSLVGVVSNRDIGTHGLIKRFIKGIFIRKPSLPRYNVTWNVALVLKHLETVNSHSCSLIDLSKKLAMLLALTNGQRVQSLRANDIRNMEMDMNYVKTRFGDLLKQSRPSFHLDELYIEAFKANYSLCVVGNILRYLEVTLPLRKGYSLIISTIKPYNSVSRNTLAYWLKESLRESGKIWIYFLLTRLEVLPQVLWLVKFL